jgi:hypothetical protein
MIHATVAPERASSCRGATDFNALVYVMSGRGQVGPQGHPDRGGQLAVLGRGDASSSRRAADADGRASAGSK